jgi:hypothetical protein
VLSKLLLFSIESEYAGQLECLVQDDETKIKKLIATAEINTFIIPNVKSVVDFFLSLFQIYNFLLHFQEKKV